MSARRLQGINPAKFEDLSESRRPGRKLVLPACLMLLPLLVACPPAAPHGGGTGGAGGGGTGGSSAMGCDEAPGLLVAHCGGGQCHNPGNEIPPLDLVTPTGLETRLIGKTAHEECPNGQRAYVNPSKPASGVLFERLAGNCFKPMPPLDTVNPLPPAHFVDCLKKWVESKL